MQWVTKESAFREVLIEARRLAFIDSGRELTNLQKFTFDHAELCTPRFLRLLQSLTQLSGDERAYYLVLVPDPIHYFHRHFAKYPLLAIDRNESPDDYLIYLNEDPGGSPADAVGTNWSTSVIFPAGAKWFGHLMRSASDNGGHLWIPPEWGDKIIGDYPFLRPDHLVIKPA